MLFALASILLTAPSPPMSGGVTAQRATARASVRVVAGYRHTPANLEIPPESQRRSTTIRTDDGSRLAADLVEFH